MRHSSLDPKRSQEINQDIDLSGHPTIDTSRALVVGRSQINRVVVSRILEKTGLRPLSVAPEAALKALEQPFPGTIILDGGADNGDCDALMQPLMQLRAVLGSDAPRVVLLSTRLLGEKELAALPAIDTAVAKPITPERLQSVLERLRD